MTKFKLSVSLLDENISMYKECKSSCLVDLEAIYNSLKNLDTGWNDGNTMTFLNIAKNDKYKIDNYFKKMDSFYRQLENMRNGFENLLAKYGYNRRGTLNYNDDYYQDCIRCLNNVLEYLNRALHYANCCRFKDDFAARAQVSALRNEIRKMKSTTRNLSGRVTGFRNGVNRLLGNANHNFSRMGNIELVLDPFLYNWNLVDSRIVKKEISELRIDGVNQRDIATDSEVLSSESYLRGTQSATTVAHNTVDKEKVGDDNTYNIAQDVIFHAANASNVATNSEVLSSESYLRGTQSATTVAHNAVDKEKVGDNKSYQNAQNVVFHTANTNAVKTDSEVLSTESYLKDIQSAQNVKDNVVDSSLVGDDNEYHVGDNVNFYTEVNANSGIDLNELNHRSK